MTFQSCALQMPVPPFYPPRTVFARDRELKNMDKMMEEFDGMVYDLWKEMVQIEYQLKNADLRLITR